MLSGFFLKSFKPPLSARFKPVPVAIDCEVEVPEVKTQLRRNNKTGTFLGSCVLTGRLAGRAIGGG